MPTPQIARLQVSPPCLLPHPTHNNTRIRDPSPEIDPNPPEIDPISARIRSPASKSVRLVSFPTHENTQNRSPNPDIDLNPPDIDPYPPEIDPDPPEIDPISAQNRSPAFKSVRFASPSLDHAAEPQHPV